MTLPIYNLTEGDITAMSLVLDPAVGEDFMCFSREDGQPMRFFNDEKRIITGVACLADTPIFRRSAAYGDHYVVFTPDMIERMVISFMKSQHVQDVNTGHKDFVDGISIFESVITDPTKMTSVLFPDIPAGSWIVSYKVDNPDLYARIKSGELRGFSIEGVFTYPEKPVNVSDTEGTIKEDELERLINDLI